MCNYGPVSSSLYYAAAYVAVIDKCDPRRAAHFEKLARAAERREHKGPRQAAKRPRALKVDLGGSADPARSP